jgi:uncharacterized protein YuzE
MARVHINDIIKLIKSHPDYENKWKLDVDADIALYISFDSPEGKILESDSLETADGSTLAIDRDKNEVVYGLEIT